MNFRVIIRYGSVQPDAIEDFDTLDDALELAKNALMNDHWVRLQMPKNVKQEVIKVGDMAIFPHYLVRDGNIIDAYTKTIIPCSEPCYLVRGSENYAIDLMLRLVNLTEGQPMQASILRIWNHFFTWKHGSNHEGIDDFLRENFGENDVPF